MEAVLCGLYSGPGVAKGLSTASKRSDGAAQAVQLEKKAASWHLLQVYSDVWMLSSGEVRSYSDRTESVCILPLSPSARSQMMQRQRLQRNQVV
jgi:hypothetical protein